MKHIKNKKTRVYSVFPACGKTWLCEHQDDYGLRILDSDSSYFAWVWECSEDDECGIHNPNARKTNERNPSFPQNYIDHIKCNLESGKYNCIFVSSHSSVREALDKEGIEFTIVYPAFSCKAEWVGRCFIRDKNRENGCGAEAMYNNWEQWINECVETGATHKEIVLQSREYLSNHFGL